MNTSDEQIKKKIIELLRKHPEGLTIKAISEFLKLHRQTVVKYIFELKGAGIVYRRRVGSATLNYLVEVLEKIKEISEEGEKVAIPE